MDNSNIPIPIATTAYSNHAGGASDGYNFVGCVEFLKSEWRSMELQRAMWDRERDEYKVKVSRLEAELRGQENLKHDMVRRIKMLEYALRAERAKFLKLLHEKEGNGELLGAQGSPHTPQRDSLPPPDNSQKHNSVNSLPGNFFSDKASSIAKTPEVLKQSLSTETPNRFKGRSPRSRELLKQYLEELSSSPIPQMPHFSAVAGAMSRSKDMSSSLGLSQSFSSDDLKSAPNARAAAVRATMLTATRNANRVPSESPKATAVARQAQSEARTLPKPREMAEKADAEAPKPEAQPQVKQQKKKPSRFQVIGVQENAETMKTKGQDPSSADDGRDGTNDSSAGPPASEGGGSSEVQGGGENVLHGINQADLEKFLAGKKKKIKSPVASTKDKEPDAGEARREGSGGVEQPKEAASGTSADMGELTEITVNENEPVVSEDIRRLWKPHQVLKSHLDGVRSIAFHPKEPLLLSCSEDCTVKLWRTDQVARSRGAADLEPVFTFRGHTEAVLDIEVLHEHDKFFSASMDSSIVAWKVPAKGHSGFGGDQYSGKRVNSGLKLGVYEGHTDAVWSLTSLVDSDESLCRLFSSGADGTIRVWSAAESVSSPLLEVYRGFGSTPVSIDLVKSDSSKIFVGFNSGETMAALVDVETGTVVTKFSAEAAGGSMHQGNQVNKAVTHPTLPMGVTVHEDRYIRFYDFNSGRCTESILGHQDSVSSAAFDPSALYLLTGGHDCSLRCWDVATKACTQELSAHRPKFDEGVTAVAFHPLNGMMASAGADSIIKLYK